MFVVVTCILCLLLVGIYTYRKVKSQSATKDGYFLAGRSLSWYVIASSIILANLSTEQLVGQTGQSYATNMGPMAWEATACLGLIMLALVFLPRYLRYGITTIPEYLAQRYDETTKRIVAILMLLGYLLTYLPTVLYSGALVFNQIFQIDELLGISHFTAVALVAFCIGIIGTAYAIIGGLKASATADSLFGIGLAVGGCMVPVLALTLMGDGNFITGFETLLQIVPAEKFNSINPANSVAPMVPWPVLFTGLFFNMLFYFCTNQAIIQRTLAAKSLKEAQKGAIIAGIFKVFCPLFITLCGPIAYGMFGSGLETADLAYPMLVLEVIPTPLMGFFAAVLFGAILSSFNGGLNGSVALYTLDIHKPIFNPGISDKQLVKVGRRFGFILAAVSICVAPFVAYAPTGLYDFLQECFGFYNVPILAIVVMGFFSKRVPARAAKASFVFHLVFYSLSKLFPFHYLYALSVLFPLNLLLMYIIGRIWPRETDFVPRDAHVIDMTPWKYRKPASIMCLVILGGLYIVFSPLGLAK